MTEAQQKRQAWLLVEHLANEALEVLVAANEAPVEQAMLSHLRDKAAVQQKLWSDPQ